MGIHAFPILWYCLKPVTAQGYCKRTEDMVCQGTWCYDQTSELGISLPRHILVPNLIWGRINWISDQLVNLCDSYTWSKNQNGFEDKPYIYNTWILETIQDFTVLSLGLLGANSAWIKTSFSGYLTFVMFQMDEHWWK